MSPRPLVLVILDGWGYGPPGPGNAIARARKPVYDRLLRDYPNTLIHTSGPFVGLPEGQMGNSEVGHLNIGAGRVVQMDITRLDQAIGGHAVEVTVVDHRDLAGLEARDHVLGAPVDATRTLDRERRVGLLAEAEAGHQAGRLRRVDPEREPAPALAVASSSAA